MTEYEFDSVDKYCPKCGHITQQTYVGIITNKNEYYDSVNRAYCDIGENGCGWHGMVYELISKEEKNKLKQKKY